MNMFPRFGLCRFFQSQENSLGQHFFEKLTFPLLLPSYIICEVWIIGFSYLTGVLYIYLSIEKVELLRYFKLTQLFFSGNRKTFFVQVIWENKFFDKLFFFFFLEVSKFPSIFRHVKEVGFRNLTYQDDVPLFTYYIQCRKEKICPKLS